MATTNYLLTKTQNSSSESQIILRTYVNHDFRLRVQSGIWINIKRWGKKNGITIPTTPGEEQESLIQKKETLKQLTAFIECSIAETSDKSIIDRQWGEKQVKKFYKPVRKSSEKNDESFVGMAEKYLATQKLSIPRQKNFKVIMRSLRRFELFKRKSSRGFKLTFSNLTPEVLRQIEDFWGNEKGVFLNLQIQRINRG